MNDALESPYIPTESQIAAAHHQGMKAAVAGHAPTHNPYVFSQKPVELQQAWGEGHALIAAFAAAVSRPPAREDLGEVDGLSVAGLIQTFALLPVQSVTGAATVFSNGEPVTGVTTSWHWVQNAADVQVYLHTESDPASSTPVYNALAAG